MTLLVPSWMQNAEYNAVNDRLLIETIVATDGVERGFEITQTPTSSMQVRVAAGRAFIKWTSNSNYGMYHVVNDGNIDIDIANASTANPRVDRVILEIRDSQYSGSNNDANIRVISGTPAASPTAPAEPANSITLATITVPRNAVSIVTANINTIIRSTARISNTLSPQAIRCTSTTRPTVGIVDGVIIQETDTGMTRIRVGNVWRILSGQIYAANVISSVVQSTVSGWQITSANAVSRNAVVTGYVAFKRTGGTINTGSSGNIGNQQICVVKEDYRPAITVAAATTSTGRTALGYINSSGTVVLANVAPGSNIVTGEAFTLSWTSPTAHWEET